MADLLLPSEIPWDVLRGKDLEECLYWLLDDLGAKELEWRIGGTGGGAADVSRDIEATFHLATPDGDLIPQRWWVEVKGRSRTVEPSAVKDAAASALGYSGLDVVVIATNSLFSNPTRDWVREWNASHARPRVRLWDRNELERLLTRHPNAAIRLFPSSLTLEGRVEVIRSRFWDRCYYASERDLVDIWKDDNERVWSADLIAAITVSEFANGRIEDRPWVTRIPDEALIHVIVHMVVNAGYFMVRAERTGTKHEAYIRAAAYFILDALNRFSADEVAGIIDHAWDFTDSDPWPQEVRDILLKPILSAVKDEIRDVCVNDCRRVISDPISLTKNEIETYWLRFQPAIQHPRVERDGRVLVIESFDRPCNVGFKLTKDAGCPALRMTDEEESVDLATAFRHIKDIMAYRRSARSP